MTPVSTPLLAIALTFAVAFAPDARAGDSSEVGFLDIFDGRSFNAWKAPDMSYWSIEDGAITARITREHPCTVNQYLVWDIGELADFELKLKSRVNGEGAINNGFQFRSRVLPDGDVAGYQMDNNLQTDWLVRLYDEFGRHTLAFRGKRTVIDADGRFITTDIPEAVGKPWFRLEDWHEYHLICKGLRLILYVDGRLAADVEDHDRARLDLRGVLAMQLHSGPPTVAQFKDIRLKVLRPTSAVLEPRWTRADSDKKRQIILASSLAWWDLGVGGHGARRPLKQVGDLDFDVRAQGHGALHGATVADLRNTWFDAGTDLNLAGPTLTTYIRLRDPSGRWNQALFSKHGSGDKMSFSLRGENPPRGSGPHVVFEIRTTEGSARASFPVSRIAATGWHDLLARYDGSSIDLFCDGSKLAHQPWNGGLLLANDAPTFIGGEGDGGKTVHAFTGQIEEAAIWQKALPDSEIAILMRTREVRGGPRNRR